ncbi:MAG: NYN domain-containing protein [Desulfarculus sp.]|nr:NYN domain-containing protein [Desulfarculus sp.]
MHLIIDGYNLIHQAPELFLAADLGRGREALCTALRIYHRKKNHRLTVVFDGGPDQEPSRSSLCGVPVIFSGQRVNADGIIAHLAVAQGAGATVITDDRELARRCRAGGAEVIEARVFAARLMDTAQGWLPAGEDDDQGWDFTTKKKGPSQRAPKARRRKERRLGRL